MLKYEIDATDFDALSDAHKELYTQEGDKYRLSVEGAPNKDEIERLRQAKDKLLAEKKAEQAKQREAEAEKLRLEEEAAKAKGDVDALEQTYKAKLEAKERQIAEMQQTMEKEKVERESMEIAAQLTSNPTNQKLLQRFVQDRLTVSDGEVKALDADGKSPLNSIADLVNEFKTCGQFDALISGTQASGTGATGQGAKGAKSAHEYTEAERIELAQTNPTLFAQLFTLQE